MEGAEVGAVYGWTRETLHLPPLSPGHPSVQDGPQDTGRVLHPQSRDPSSPVSHEY